MKGLQMKNICQFFFFNKRFAKGCTLPCARSSMMMIHHQLQKGALILLPSGGAADDEKYKGSIPKTS